MSKAAKKVVKSSKKQALTNQDVLTLQQWLWEAGDIKGTKFAYAVLKNRKIVDAYAKKLQDDSLSPKKNFQKYEMARLKLAEKHAKKDGAGKPIINQNRYDIKDQAKFDKAIEKLQEKHKVAIEEREKQAKDFQLVLKQPANIELHLISSVDLPGELTANLLDGLSLLMTDDQA